MSKYKRFFLAAIVLLAAGLRFYKLGQNPPSLTWDEAAWGYNAYSLGLTGADEFGRRWPLDYLESFGDFKPPVYAYLTILPVKIFGLTEFATRFPAALLGTLAVLLTYYLINELFINGLKMKKTQPVNSLINNKSIALIAAFLLAISPWHIMLSRAAFEANVASFFIVAGVTAFLAGIRKKNWLLIISAISFALSMQTFNTARIVTPLLVLILTIVFRKILWQNRRISLAAVLAGGLVILPAVSFLLSPQAKLRFKEVNIFSDPEVVQLANQQMANVGWSWWSRIIYNRRWGYARSFLTHYFDHFKPSFLFIKGDGNPKFSTQDVGELYLWEAPFLLIGIFVLLKYKRGYWWLVPLWLLIGIIPAATARETPHALRIETTLPTWQILTALGLVAAWKKYKIIVLASCLLLLVSLIAFQHGYWRHYPIEFSGEWQYGYREATEFLQAKAPEYEEIWFTQDLGRPYIYLAFYLQANPREFPSQIKAERDAFGFVKISQFGKYHFFGQQGFQPEGKALIVQSASKIPPDASVLKTIRMLNGKPVFKIYEN